LYALHRACRDKLNNIVGIAPGWTRAVEKQNVKISMDGKGRAIENIWIERFLKTIKYNYLTFHTAETGLELYKNVDYYVKYYKNKKHQTTGQKPNDAHMPLNTQNLAS
jgi:putative transposase